MKKLFFLTIVLFAFGMSTFSQSFEKNDQAINLGIGFGNTAYWGSGYTGFIPSISASYEYAIVEVPMGSDLTGVVGVGGYFGWAASNYAYNYWGDVKYHYNTVYFGARGNYHFIFHDKLDTYAGVWLGGKVVNGKWKGSGSHPDNWHATNGGVTGGVYVGARWLFTDSFAVYAELGYLISVFNIGVAWRID